MDFKLKLCTFFIFKALTLWENSNNIDLKATFFLQVKLVWYYNNALGRPNKKKFIARLNSLVDSQLLVCLQ